MSLVQRNNNNENDKKNVIDNDDTLSIDSIEYAIEDEYKYCRIYVFVTISVFVIIIMLIFILLFVAWGSNISTPFETMPYVTSVLLNSLYTN